LQKKYLTKRNKQDNVNPIGRFVECFFVSALQCFRFSSPLHHSNPCEFYDLTLHPMVFPVLAGEGLESPEFFGRE
jgi:hypothetical protein